MQIVDSHWHLYIHTAQDGRDFRTVMDEYIKENGISAVNLCCIPIYGGLGPEQNILAALYKLHNPNAYAYAGLVYPTCPFQKPMPAGMSPLEQYEELMAVGFDGIKMLETKPTEQKQYDVRIDDSYFDSFFAACARDKTHMVWHVADPDTFWDIDRIPQRFLDRGWFFGDGTYLSREETYGQVLNVLEKNPDLAVTFAHFFFWSGEPEKLERLFAQYPNVSVDITPGSEMYAAFRENHAFYRDFFIRYADRILLGSDTSVKGDDMERFRTRFHALLDFVRTDKEVTVITETCPGLALPEDAAAKILGGNFRTVAGVTPKAIDPVALQRYTEKYLHLIPDKSMAEFLRSAVQTL